MKKKWIVGLLTMAGALVGTMGLTACDYLNHWQFPTEETLYFQQIEGKEEYRVVSVGTYAGSALEIPDSFLGLPVTEIGAGAFKGATQLTSVIIPNTVTAIGDSAFENCIGIQEVTLSNTLTNIGNSAFRNCESITQLILPVDLEFIGYWAFSGCRALETVYYKGTTEDWQEVGVALYNDELTQQATKYDYSSTEPNCAPAGEHWRYVNGEMTVWTTVHHEWGVINVVAPTCTQDGCDLQICELCGDEKRTNVTPLLGHDWEIQETVAPTCTEQGYSVRKCAECQTDEKINYVSATGHSWGDKSIVAPTCTDEGFDKRVCDVCQDVEKTNIVSANGHGEMLNGNCTVCGSQLATDGVVYTVSANGTYAIVTSYTGTSDSVVIADLYQGVPVTEIAASAFAKNTSIQYVELPLSITTIGVSAFSGCESLQTLAIPANVKSIGEKAFGGCTALTAFTVSSANTAYAAQDGHLYTKDGTTLLQYALGKDASSFVTPAGVTKIAAYAFVGSTRLTSVTVSAGVLEIGARAFENCSALTEVVLPEGLIAIANSTFAKCSALTTIHLPSTLMHIGSWAFGDCTALTSITLPEICESIGEYAFFQCTALTSVTLNDSLRKIGANAFAWCTELREIVIPDSVTEIGASAFTKCYLLKIYCELASEPLTWDVDWNADNCTVVWGA